MNSSYIPLAALAGALISAVIAYASIIISKENKVSEFRQAWIDEFRKEIAEFVSSLQVFLLKNNERLADKDADIKDVEMNYARMLMRLDPAKNHAIEETLNKIKNAVRDRNYSLVHQLTDKLVQESRIMLDEHWNRVKEGEPAFKRFKLLLPISMAVILLVAPLYIKYAEEIAVNKPPHQSATFAHPSLGNTDHKNQDRKNPGVHQTS